MLLNLAKLLLEDGKTMHCSVEPELKEIDFRMGRFQILEKKPLDLTIRHLGNKEISIHGTTELIFEIPCGRCLQPVRYTMPIDLERTADMKLSEAELEEELEESCFFVGEQLDPEVLLHNEILVNWPIRVLCKEDCKGICSRCGANLNTSSCDCDQEPKDPRMAAIQDIFSKFKEV
ncbi:MAG: DUF177 domain-containing protein [Lachnospiraceae bacterium]|nr:DUF177 domain-containing protein [Lachnospiraceae bacterium]